MERIPYGVAAKSSPIRHRKPQGILSTHSTRSSCRLVGMTIPFFVGIAPQKATPPAQRVRRGCRVKGILLCIGRPMP